MVSVCTVAVNRMSNLCLYIAKNVCEVSVCTEAIALTNMQCTCVWAASTAKQLDDQSVKVYSYPECKSVFSDTQQKQTFQSFPTTHTK